LEALFGVKADKYDETWKLTVGALNDKHADAMAAQRIAEGAMAAMSQRIASAAEVAAEVDYTLSADGWAGASNETKRGLVQAIAQYAFIDEVPARDGKGKPTPRDAPRRCTMALWTQEAFRGLLGRAADLLQTAPQVTTQAKSADYSKPAARSRKSRKPALAGGFGLWFLAPRSICPTNCYAATAGAGG